jgi:hypothetical protein
MNLIKPNIGYKEPKRNLIKINNEHKPCPVCHKAIERAEFSIDYVYKMKTYCDDDCRKIAFFGREIKRLKLKKRLFK